MIVPCMHVFARLSVVWKGGVGILPFPPLGSHLTVGYACFARLFVAREVRKVGRMQSGSRASGQICEEASEPGCINGFWGRSVLGLFAVIGLGGLGST